MKFESGFKFMDNLRDYEVIEFIEKFNMYRVRNFTDNRENELLSEAQIQSCIDNIESIKDRREKNRIRQEQQKAEDEAIRIQEEQEQKEYNFDFGYTENMTSMQKGKVLKTLNKKVLYADEIISRKRLIEKLLKENQEAELRVVNNTNRHSQKRIELEYKKLKDKVEYRLYYNNRILELTLTEFKFAQYLLDNDLI